MKSTDLGVAVVDAEGGTQPAEVAGHLASLGYDTALLVDSDAKAKASRARSKGALVLEWSGAVSIEERLSLDLDPASFTKLLELAAYKSRARNPRSVRDAVAGRVGLKPAELGDDPTDWPSQVDDNKLRQAVGQAAKEKEWFKSREHGIELGKLAYALAETTTPSADTIRKLREFVLA